MDHMSYWSHETNAATGTKFEHFRQYMECTQNGTANVDALLNSAYGQELTRLMQLRFTYEEKEPMGDEVRSYYESIGIRKQMFEIDDFFTRWALFSPMWLENDRLYPLIIWNHGGKETIEEEEYITDLVPMAAKEKYMVIMAQNTCWDNIERIIDLAADCMPIDTERVYVGGFSQGGRIAGACALRFPEKLAGVVLNGGPIFDTTDNHEVSYTILEIQNMTAKLVPFMQLQNQCDVSNVVPLNDYHKRPDTPHVDNQTYANPNYDRSKDPTYLYTGITRERVNPPADQDVHIWLMNMLNLRMATLGCAFRDTERCLSYIDNPEDEFHHAVGFYGDEEKIMDLNGCRHYMVDIFNRDGLDAFRYVLVSNTNHWPPVTLGALIWDFFRQFRRDSATGRIVRDVYDAERS